MYIFLVGSATQFATQAIQCTTVRETYTSRHHDILSFPHDSIHHPCENTLKVYQFTTFAITYLKVSISGFQQDIDIKHDTSTTEPKTCFNEARLINLYTQARSIPIIRLHTQTRSIQTDNTIELIHNLFYHNYRKIRK